MMSIDGFPIDIFEKEKHTLKSEITDHPVESGGDVADNIHNMPDELEVEGIVSDNPIGLLAQDPTRQGDSKPSVNAYEKLKALRAKRDVFTVVCSKGRFENMAMEELSQSIEAKNSKSFTFTCKFKKLTIVLNKRVTVAVPNVGGGGGTEHKASEEWGKRFKIKNAIFVITVQSPMVPQYTKTFGPPTKAKAKILSQAQALPIIGPVPPGEFYFEVKGGAVPDAYIDSNGTVHPFSVQAGLSGPKVDAAFSKFGPTGRDRIGPDPLHYDYGKNAWVTQNGTVFSKQENPADTPDGFTPDDWHARTMGWAKGTAPPGI